MAYRSISDSEYADWAGPDADDEQRSVTNVLTGEVLYSIGDTVESHRYGAGQPYLRGTLVAIERGEAVIYVGKNTLRRRSVGNIRRVREERN